MNDCNRCGYPLHLCDCPVPGAKTEKLNPWTTPLPDMDRPRWEFVPIEKTAEKHPDLYRMRVPGGWLYRLAKSDTMIFARHNLTEAEEGEVMDRAYFKLRRFEAWHRNEYCAGCGAMAVPSDPCVCKP